MAAAAGAKQSCCMFSDASATWRGVFRFLDKPVEIDRLADAVSAACHAH